MEKSNGASQILTGSLRTGTIDQRKGIVAVFRQLQRMRKTVLHGSYIDKASSRTADCRLAARLSAEEKQAGIFLFEILCFFLFRVDVKKDLTAGGGLFSQIIYNLHGLIRITSLYQGRMLSTCSKVRSSGMV